MKTFTPSPAHHGQNATVGVLPGEKIGARTGSSEQRRSPTSADLLMLARRVCAARTKRQSFFESDLFAEPGWEMLLALYAADATGQRMTISNLCYASNAPDTTALRWLDKLTELNLVRRQKNPLDARMVFIELEVDARTAIQSYLGDIWVLLYGPL